MAARRSRRTRTRHWPPGLVLALIVALGLPLVAGGVYLAWRRARPQPPPPAPPAATDERSRLEAFRSAILGRWESRLSDGRWAVIEFRADGTYGPPGPTAPSYRWEAVRTDGDRVIVRSSTPDGVTVELPYWFVSADEYRYVGPDGQTRTVRRVK
jgi:hypothetical protein